MLAPKAVMAGGDCTSVGTLPSVSRAVLETKPVGGIASARTWKVSAGTTSTEFEVAGANEVVRAGCGGLAGEDDRHLD